jgi:hypothetical protein
MPQLRKKWRFSEEYPIGDKTPPHHHDLSLSCITVQSDYRLEGLRRDVPRRPEVRDDWTVYRKEVGDLLLIGATDVSTTHDF